MVRLVQWYAMLVLKEDTVAKPVLALVAPAPQADTPLLRGRPRALCVTLDPSLPAPVPLSVFSASLANTVLLEAVRHVSVASRGSMLPNP